MSPTLRKLQQTGNLMPIDGPQHPLIFDGHNDQLSLLEARSGQDSVALFADNPSAAISVSAARIGGFAGGLFAIWVPSPGTGGPDLTAMAAAKYDVPLPDAVPQQRARQMAQRQVTIMHALVEAGQLRLCLTGEAVEDALAGGEMAAVLHMEGAEPIGRDLADLDAFYADGLRSLGPVWSRPNGFGHGVPFRFPASPDTGPGLTDDGKRLVRRCNELGIMVDVSHLTERGFWDVAEVSRAPIVATHSNAHALCPAARNLTDKQLAAIAERGGLVGVNFATAFLRRDGRMVPQVTLDTVVRQFDYLLERLGEDGVAFGSDYDGAIVPEALTTVAGLPGLRREMLAHGYGEALMAKLCHQNWIAMLKKSLRPC